MNAGSALTTPEAVVALRILRRAVLVIVLAAGLAVSACSYPPPGSESAAQVMPEVQAASETATSVHVAGSVRNGTQTTTMNVRIYGDSVAGTLGAYGTGFYVLSLNGASFVRLNAAFLSVENAPASLCAQICGRYVELPASSASQITGLLSMQQLISQVFNNKNMSTAAGSGCIYARHPGRPGGAAVQSRQLHARRRGAWQALPALLERPARAAPGVLGVELSDAADSPSGQSGGQPQRPRLISAGVTSAGCGYDGGTRRIQRRRPREHRRLRPGPR
jgi:hypothetical protein